MNKHTIISIIALAFCFFTLMPVNDAWSQTTPTDLVIIFDTSGSMRDYVKGQPKIDIAKDALIRFIDTLPETINLGLIMFNNCYAKKVRDIKPASVTERTELKKAIRQLDAFGPTPIGETLKLANLLLQNSKNKKRVVIITDGDETCNLVQLQTWSEKNWKAGIKTYAIGFAFGYEPNPELKRIGIYLDAGDNEQLATVFQEIKQLLERDDKKFDESQSAADEKPPVSFVGKKGRFKQFSPRQGRLYLTLQFNSTYEANFGPEVTFTVLEHGYNIYLDNQSFQVRQEEALKIKVDEMANSPLSGLEGFVHLEDVTIE